MDEGQSLSKRGIHKLSLVSCRFDEYLCGVEIIDIVKNRLVLCLRELLNAVFPVTWFILVETMYSRSVNKHHMELVVPSQEFKSAFERFYDDFAQNDVENAEYYLEGKADFPKYVQHLSDEAAGLNLREGHVPCSHFWLIDNEKSIFGAIRVRHNIDNNFLAFEAGHIGYDIAPSHRGKGNGKLMLKLAISKAAELGIERVLLIADEDNFASRGVIEANGGKFEKIVIGQVFPHPLARYWINCK
ncbi:GNAT family N-acetyltransferase [Gynuella sunshinyii]|uniref:GNAT family N-acetyltransferase n=1 Tax=Gynuella sunshinyii TaxID=1445505 RepID=UPI001FE01FA6|nr:GNAT family N-acetyltransferase [Gynuella sunshinyii]